MFATVGGKCTSVSSTVQNCLYIVNSKFFRKLLKLVEEWQLSSTRAVLLAMLCTSTTPSSQEIMLNLDLEVQLQ